MPFLYIVSINHVSTFLGFTENLMNVTKLAELRVFFRHPAHSNVECDKIIRNSVY